MTKGDGDRLAARDAARKKQGAERVRLLDDETNRLRDAAGERARSVDAKSSFLAVTAGVVLTAAFTRTDQSSSEDWLMLLPVVFAVLAIAASVVALRPSARREVTPDSLFIQWMDTEQSLAAVERNLLEQKIQAYRAREKDITHRAQTTTVGFVLLLASTVALLFTYSA